MSFNPTSMDEVATYTKSIIAPCDNAQLQVESIQLLPESTAVKTATGERVVSTLEVYINGTVINHADDSQIGLRPYGDRIKPLDESRSPKKIKADTITCAQWTKALLTTDEYTEASALASRKRSDKAKNISMLEYLQAHCKDRVVTLNVLTWTKDDGTAGGNNYRNIRRG